MSKRVKTVGMLMALMALPFSAAYAEALPAAKRTAGCHL